MKILNINTSLGIGGTERAAVNYTVGYKELGHDSRFMVIYGGHERIGRLEEKEILLYNYIGNEGIIDELKAWRPDVLHIHRSNEVDPNIKNVIEDFKTSCGSLVAETNVFSRYINSTWYKQNIDISFQLSQWCLWKYNQWKGSNSKPLSAYGPYAVENENFYKADDLAVERFKLQQGIDKDSFVIGRLGQPLDSKWHPEIIAFFARACNQYSNLTLFLVGPSPSVINNLNGLTDDIREKVKVIDRIEGDEQLRLYYSSLDIFLHYSTIGESFGYVLVEAMMCGVPVITWSTLLKDNSQIEVVGNRIGGLVVNSSKSLRKAFDLLYNDYEMRLKISAGLRDWVLKRFEAKIVCAGFVKLFDEMRQGNDHVSQPKYLSPWKLISVNGLNYSIWSKISLMVIHQHIVYQIYKKVLNRLR